MRPCFIHRFYPYRALRHTKLFYPMPLRQENALVNMRTALDMDEIFERVAIRNHGSFLVHGAIFKATRDILRVGNPWACDMSDLELQNAETKRVATSSGSKRLTTSAAGVSMKPMRGSHEGPAQLVKTKGYNTTMALSTLNNLLATQHLRRGHGMPESRRTERLFGVDGDGRSKLKSSGFKHKAGPTIAPQDDTCLSAFVRLLAKRAAQNTGAV